MDNQQTLSIRQQLYELSIDYSPEVEARLDHYQQCLAQHAIALLTGYAKEKIDFKPYQPQAVCQHIALYGPMRSGKTLNAHAIANAFSCTTVIEADDFTGQIDWHGRTLWITNATPEKKRYWKCGTTGQRRGIPEDAVWLPIGLAQLAIGADWIEPELIAPQPSANGK